MGRMREFLLLPLASLLLWSCSSDDTDLAAFANAAQQRGNAFQLALRTELMQAMQEGGPANAIAVCSQRATAIAASVSTDGYTVRRVGTRLRNPGNAPSERDRAALAQFEARDKKDDSPIRVRNDDAAAPKFSLYLPLRAGEMCITCHGDPTSLPQAARDALSQRYPQDQATGYALGDLRGAVVVEAAR
jgi:hypothetical protein